MPMQGLYCSFTGDKMAKRTVQSCWKQFEKFSTDYLTGSKSEADCRAKMDDLSAKANEDLIASSLFVLFVKPHLPLDLDLVFDCDLDEGVPKWQTRYDSENKRIVVHPVSIVKFIREIQESEVSDDDYEDFLHLRYVSFLQEVKKLPSLFILFMMVLQRTAYLLEVAHLEKRGGIVEIAEGEAYHTLLWAFKELEAIGPELLSKNIRSDFSILWYESEWITGR
jgi:hypothetical protein